MKWGTVAGSRPLAQWGKCGASAGWEEFVWVHQNWCTWQSWQQGSGCGEQGRKHAHRERPAKGPHPCRLRSPLYLFYVAAAGGGCALTSCARRVVGGDAPPDALQPRPLRRLSLLFFLAALQ